MQLFSLAMVEGCVGSDDLKGQLVIKSTFSFQMETKI